MNLSPIVHELSVVQKGSGLARLGDIIHWPQQHIVDVVSRNLDEGRPTRLIVLKARQLGISTIAEAIQFTLAMLNDNFRGQIITHLAKTNSNLLGMAQTFFNYFPYEAMYVQRYGGQQGLGWEPNNSRIGVATARTEASGRGETIHYLHGSEVAFWDNASGNMAALGQAVPKSPFSFVLLESTANGLGNWFSTTWDDAVSGDNDYVPLFFPWQTHDEYRIESVGLAAIDLTATVLDEHEQALYDFFAEDRLGEENREVLARSMTPAQIDTLGGPVSHDEILARLAWRRYIIRNDFAGDHELFWQEYPHRPTIAFLSTGRNVFPLHVLEPIYKPVPFARGDVVNLGGNITFSKDALGPLKVFKAPDAGRHYIIGGDPTFSMGGDYGCMQVLDRRSWEQVAVWRGKLDPGSFGQKMTELGWWYNQALLAPESNRDGATTVGRILGLDYPHVWQRQSADALPNYAGSRFGWFTNARTKNEALGALKHNVVERSLSIHDPHTFSEMKNYVDLGLGKFGNANNWVANASNNVTITNVAPAGVGTATISKWLEVKDDSDAVFYIPVWT